MHNLHKKFKTEADLMKRAWSIIDCCFDNGDLDVISYVFVINLLGLSARYLITNVFNYIQLGENMCRKRLLPV